MTTTTRNRILRADAGFLVLAALGGLWTDICAGFLARGPLSLVLRDVPEAAIGSFEAHGLALIFGVLMWRAVPVKSVHLTGVAIHLLLGAANLLFWRMFITADLLVLGYVTTFFHFSFVGLQLCAAAAVGPERRAELGTLVTHSGEGQ
jgi:hypothetical protein